MRCWNMHSNFSIQLRHIIYPSTEKYVQIKSSLTAVLNVQVLWIRSSEVNTIAQRDPSSIF